MPYLVNYLPIVIDAFVIESKREYLDGDTFSLLTIFVIEKLSQLKMSLAVDVMFETLKSLGNK